MNIKHNHYYRSIVAYMNCHYPVLMAKLRFRMMFGRKLNLKKPQDLNEKILWLALYSDTSMWSKLADKYEVREYVSDKGLEDILVKLYGKWENAEEINWDELPNSFVLKSNNGCGTVKLVNDKNSLDIPKTVKLLNSWLHQYGLSTTEPHYRSIKPCLIVEQLLTLTEEEMRYSSSIVDYKIWCFNGKPKYVWTVSNRNNDGFDGCLFDTSWNVMTNVLRKNGNVKQATSPLPKPKNLERMIEIAGILSKDFPEVRVDLYNVDGKIYFGEMTFTTHGGTIDYFTPKQLFKMGQMIDLSNIKKVR